jgi:hypothetical protein
MAATWICEKCGRANPGDLCPGCAEPRPIRVRSAYGSDHNREIFDGVSEPRREPASPLPFMVIAFFAIIGLASTDKPWFFLIFCLLVLMLLFVLNVSVAIPVVLAIQMWLRYRRK